MPLRDVELVEDGSGPPEDGSRPPEDGPARSWPHRHRRVLTGLAVVLVVALATGGVLELRARRHDAARAATLRDVPGVLAPLDPALPVALQAGRSWEDEESLPLSVLTHVAGVGAGDLVVAGVVEPDGLTVVGAPVGAGDARWRTPVGPPEDAGPVRPATIWCATSSWPAEDVVMRAEDPGAPVGCTAEWLGPVEQAADGSATRSSRTALLEVDPRDGRVLHRVDPGPAQSTARVGDGWVTSTRTGASVQVQRLAGDGTVRWTTTLDAGDASGPDTWGVLHGDADRVLVHRDDGVWVLDAADGAVRTALPGTRAGRAQLVPGDRVLLEDVSQPVRANVLHLPDGTSHDLDGDRVVRAGVDDGSLGDVLVTASGRDGGRTTLRRADGTVLWHADGVQADAVALVDGTVVVLADGGLARLDGRDGHERWRVPLVDAEDGGQVLTDGRLLLVGTANALDAVTFDGAHAWTAAVLRDGDEVRVRVGQTPTATLETASMPGAATWVAGRDGRLVLVLTAAALVREDVLVFG